MEEQELTSKVVFATPPFPFTSSAQSEFEGTDRLACIEFFILHSIKLLDSEEPKSTFASICKLANGSSRTCTFWKTSRSLV